MRRTTILVAVAVGIMSAPATATAEPDRFPDLSGFTVADVKDYSGYYIYPAGSRLDYAHDEVCGITEQMTACRIGAHGFVLDPKGSWTF